MKIEILTKNDLTTFKSEILDLVKNLITRMDEYPAEWLKSAKARQMLACSPPTLQSLRNKGLIRAKKVGGSWYYRSEDILKLLSDSKLTN